MSDQPYADPQDLQFGKAAADKEDALDAALNEGHTPEELDAYDAQQRRDGNSTDVRPGGKAEPTEDND